jgi:hypothetical protein
MMENDNIIPIRKSDRFFICKGTVAETGEFIERERVGVAYLKPASSMFRLRLWMFPKGEFFLAREEGEHIHYLALCLDDYEVAGQGQRNQWHKIGVGEVIGNFIRIRFHLFPDDFYLCLFPKGSKTEEFLDAA